MADKSKIEWTDATWNPVSGCSKVSEGCRFCYAERVSHRFGHTKLPWTAANAARNVKMHEERLDQALRWKRPRRVFVNSMSDIFHENVDHRFIVKVFDVMAAAEKHTFQILTKRPHRMFEFCTWYFERFAINRDLKIPQTPPKNIWLGVSVEDQLTTYERVPLLLKTPSAVRFISAEPLLGPISLWPEGNFNTINWVIAGGESGPQARPSHPNWFRSLRDQCVEAKVPFFFKQWGEWCESSQDHMADVLGSTDAVFDNPGTMRRVGKRDAGRLLDGRTWDEYPNVEAL